MNFLNKLFAKNISFEAPNTFPYSKENSKDELTGNLKAGILFEDSSLFLNWNLTFRDIEKHCEKVKKGGDRTIFYFGKQKILNGLDIDLDSMKWLWIKDKVSFGSVNCEFGQDSKGRKKAFEIIEHLTSQFGNPTKQELESEEIEVIWNFGKTEIRVSSWCHFATRYNFKVGLINEPNWKQ